MDCISKEQIGILVRLQAIETDRRQVQTVLDNVSEKLAGLDGEIDAMSQRIQTERDRITEMKKEIRSHESDLKVNHNRISERKGKLRSVKTNKEYQSMLKEIDEMEKESGRIEDLILELLDSIDVAEKQVADFEKEFDAQTQEVSEEKARIESDASESRQQIEELTAALSETAASAAPEILRVYEKVKQKQPAGLTVVPVENAVCKGCHLNIPPQMFNELQRCDSLKFCPQCQRIIYWQEMDLGN